jgi:hypothetical protein
VVDETKNHGNHVKLVWNALLAPHHCSKKAMYEKDANGNDVLRQDILDDFETAQVPGAFIIASSLAIPESNSPGGNPPHAKARHRYEEIVSGQFLCTGECSTPENMRPIILSLTANGVVLASGPFKLSEEARAGLAAAVAKARGDGVPPSGQDRIRGLMITEGQQWALSQLQEIDKESNNQFEVVAVREAAEPGKALAVEISVDCLGYRKEPSSLPLRPRERFVISIPSEFPLDRPDVTSVHTRFAGFPHVQW